MHNKMAALELVCTWETQTSQFPLTLCESDCHWMSPHVLVYGWSPQVHCVVVGKKKKDIHMKRRIGQQQPIRLLTYMHFRSPFGTLSYLIP